MKYDLAAVIFGPRACDALQMWVADMDLRICPQIQHAIATRAAHATFGYTIQPEEMWGRVGRWLVERQGWIAAPPPGAFIYSANVVLSFANLLRALTSEGDSVVVMVPSYAPLQEAVRGSGRRLVLHPLQRAPVGAACAYSLDLAALETTLDETRPAMLLLINPHNPSGRVWTLDELAALAALCARRGILVVSDEIWADWCFGARGFVPFSRAAAGTGCRHACLNAPTKTFNLAGLHASYVVIEDAALRAAYRAYAEPATLHFGSTFATVALSAAYEHGAGWLQRARTHVAANVAFLEAYLATHVPGVVLWRPDATYLAWLCCEGLAARRGLASSGALHELFVDAGLVLSPGGEFDPTGASDFFMRINLACPRALVEAAAERMRRLASSDRHIAS